MARSLEDATTWHVHQNTVTGEAEAHDHGELTYEIHRHDDQPHLLDAEPMPEVS